MSSERIVALKFPLGVATVTVLRPAPGGPDIGLGVGDGGKVGLGVDVGLMDGVGLRYGVGVRVGDGVTLGSIIGVGWATVVAACGKKMAVKKAMMAARIFFIYVNSEPTITPATVTLPPKIIIRAT